MSNTDSFIEEVTEEVRRDRLYGYLKRYGWIAGLVIVLIVGAAAFNEYRNAQADAAAQALGDAMLAGLSEDDEAARAAALSTVEAGTAEGAAILAFLTAGVQADAEETAQAVETLNTVSNNADIPLIYRQVATFKALTLQADTLDIDARRAGFEALAVPGVSLRVVAEEQLALIDIESGNVDGAIERFRAILEDAEATTGLQRRALQAIVALGGSPSADEANE
ncbi:hypothetical protein [uncultured Tateyamaria sp.]|uniref:hypothetical protein n=1 Tax=uncultured Tateyamaria sp. TaxID=455651 RepID=UPI00260B4675|nr:hypothetical protein [uncultured Tateyamaria sp.]